MKTAIILFCIVCTALLTRAQKIKQLEYFIDKDKGVGKNIKIDLVAANDSIYQINVDVSALSNGYHKLYIRTKDSKGKWCFTAQRNIEVASTFGLPKLMTGEYFFDSDPGYGKGKKVTVSAKDTIISQSFAAATTALKTGYHKLYVRFKDSLGAWGFTATRSIEVIKTADTVKVIAAEYFFDTDKGYGKAAAKLFAEPLEDGKFKFNIQYNKIPSNATTLFIRVKDSLKRWSFTKVDTFSVAGLQNAVAQSGGNLSSTGINKLSVFPNPASGYIHVIFPQKSENGIIQIIDMNGKVVMETMAGNSTDINISKLSKGAYLLRLKDNEDEQIVKLIKQ